MESHLPMFKEKNHQLEVATELIRGQHPHLKGFYSKIVVLTCNFVTNFFSIVVIDDSPMQCCMGLNIGLYKANKKIKLNVAKMRLLKWMSTYKTRWDDECYKEKVGVTPIVKKMLESLLR
ncbi:hypothetical protein JHK82_017527 [Glycine max]|nr:hypothetical protein JHK86_017578 [Glycine max]KAG5141832.1 hypothetical protein JHK82_017527 [Glycine max]